MMGAKPDMLYDIVGKRYVFFAVSLLVIVPGLIALLIWGIKPSIDFTGGATHQIWWPFNGAVVALRGRRQQHQLGIGQFHGILHSVVDGECRHHRSPAMAARPAGQDSEMLIAARNGHSTAPFAPECQSFLDNLPAGFRAQECRFFLMMPGEILACLLCLGDRR